MTKRPVLFVLAGVNGAGKSSIGGHLLQRAGLDWFNPDTFARELTAVTNWTSDKANVLAWEEGVRRLDAAIVSRQAYAFETTLGGRTIAAKIQAATGTHDVIIWFCGLDSPERHIARVRTRVAQGGHDIPEAKIRARYPQAQRNLIDLMPRLAHLQVYDNSAEVSVGKAIPDPALVMEMKTGQLIRPADDDAIALRRTPLWAIPLVEAALSIERR